jgi:hypothetical protein
MSKLSTIFGKPGKSIHKHYCSFAVADVAMMGTMALVILKLTNKSFPLIFLALIALGIGVHAVFGIPTMLNKKIGLVPDVNSQIRDYMPGTSFYHASYTIYPGRPLYFYIPYQRFPHRF